MSMWVDHRTWNKQHIVQSSNVLDCAFQHSQSTHCMLLRVWHAWRLAVDKETASYQLWLCWSTIGLRLCMSDWFVKKCVVFIIIIFCTRSQETSITVSLQLPDSNHNAAAPKMPRSTNLLNLEDLAFVISTEQISGDDHSDHTIPLLFQKMLLKKIPGWERWCSSDRVILCHLSSERFDLFLSVALHFDNALHETMSDSVREAWRKWLCGVRACCAKTALFCQFSRQQGGKVHD